MNEARLETRKRGSVMKKLLYVLAGATALISAPALAADLGRMPVRAPVAYAPAPYFNWSGFYVGVQGGGGWGDVDWRYQATGTTAHHSTSGGLLGGTAGFNWQTGSWVFGIEADYAWADISGNTACPNPAFDCRSRLDSFGTARGRLGYAWDRFMLYGTAGAAFGDQNIRTVHLAGVNTPASGTPTNGTSRFQAGWTAGGGLEWAFAGNWSAKVEALYFDLDRDTYTVDNGLLVNARHSGGVVRGGINYRFNWGGPVMAAY